LPESTRVMSDSAYFAKELKSQTDKRILNYTALRVSHQGAHHFSITLTDDATYAL